MWLRRAILVCCAVAFTSNAEEFSSRRGVGVVSGVTQANVNSNSFAAFLGSVASPVAVGGIAGGGTDTSLTTVWSAFKFQVTSTQTGSALVMLKRDAGLTSASTIEAHLYADNSGVPGTEVSASNVPESSTGLPTIITGAGVSTAYALIEFRLPYTGLTLNGLYWVVFKVSTSGGNFIADSQSQGQNLFATAPDSSGSPGAWTGVGKSLNAFVYGNTGRGLDGFSDNHYGVYGHSQCGMGGRFISISGIGSKADSTYNIGAGGTSVWNVGVRGSSNNNIAVAGDSLGTAGGQFVCSAGAASGCVGAQVVSINGPALQAVPTTGLAWQGLDGNASNAQTSAITHDGYFTSITPFTVSTVWLNGSATVQTIGGTKLPAHAFTVTAVGTYVSVASSGAGNTVVRISDGTNNCDATMSCTTDNNTTGPKNKATAATSGTCAFASGAALTVSIATAGCATTQPTLKNIDVMGTWQ